MKHGRTRRRRQVHVTHCGRRNRQGRREPSRYLRIADLMGRTSALNYWTEIERASQQWGGVNLRRG